MSFVRTPFLTSSLVVSVAIATAQGASAQCSFGLPVTQVFEPPEVQQEFPPTDSPGPARGGRGAPSRPTSGGPATPSTPNAGGPASQRRSGGGAPITGLPTQDWRAWWIWNREEFLRPEVVREWADGDQFGATVDTSELYAIASEQLTSRSPEVRAAATLALSRTRGDGIVAKLVERLEDAHIGVRHTAILALGQVATPRATRELMQLAARSIRSNDNVSHLAAPYSVLGLALARVRGASKHTDGFVAALPELVHGEERERMLLAVLMYQQMVPTARLAGVARDIALDKDAARDVRCRAIEALALVDDSTNLDSLARIRRERELSARHSAAFALGQSDDPLAFSALVADFASEREQLAQAFSLVAVGQSDDANALRFLRDQIRNGKKALRAWAAMGLGVWARDRSSSDRDAARDAICAGLKAEHNRDAHGAYLLALGLARATSEFGALIDHLSRSPNVTIRASAAEAIRLLDDPESRVALRREFDVAKERETRAMIARLLGYHGHPDDTDVVLDEFHATLPEYRALIAGGVAHFRSRAAFDALASVVAARNGAASLRAAALRALGAMASEERTGAFARLAAHGNYLVFPSWLCVPVHSTL